MFNGRLIHNSLFKWAVLFLTTRMLQFYETTLSAWLLYCWLRTWLTHTHIHNQRHSFCTFSYSVKISFTLQTATHNQMSIFHARPSYRAYRISRFATTRSRLRCARISIYIYISKHKTQFGPCLCHENIILFAHDFYKHTTAIFVDLPNMVEQQICCFCHRWVFATAYQQIPNEYVSIGDSLVYMA